MPGKYFDELEVGKKLNNIPWLPFWKVISLLSILHLMLFDTLILTAPETLQVQYTPDDGYYYLALARNFIRFGEWTFDGGVSLTSGFHLMQAYLLVGIYNLFHPNPEDFVRLGLGLSTLITVTSVLLAWQMCLRKKETHLLILFTIVVTAKTFLFNSVSITEWSLVILIAGLYCAYFLDRPSNTANLLIPFALGLLGSLARSDFGLLPFCVFVATAVIVRYSDKTFLIRDTLAGLIGAALGVGLSTMHTFITTGAFLQSSALMKSYWSQFGTQRFYTAATLGLQILGMDFGFSTFLSSILLLSVLLLAGPVFLILLAHISGQKKIPVTLFRLDQHRSVRERILVLASILCLLGYTALYTASGAVQNWYTANVTVPVFILFAAGAGYLNGRIFKEYQFTVIWLSTFALVSLGTQLLNLYPLGSEKAPWPHQQFNLAAGRYLAQNPADGYIGSWNSGIAGYYQGGTNIVNIDGLVNNDIYPYAVQNTLPAYLQKNNIRYILDFENMFHPPFPKRGGYANAAFLESLKPIKEFDKGQFTEFKFLRLYRIDP